jgi:threonine aldolase
MLDFRSDNTAAAAPEILQALHEANIGTAPSYGGDAWTARLREAMADTFGKPVHVFPVATGTAANALSLAVAAGPFGSVYCLPESHIHLSEWNATGFFGGGTKVMPVESPGGKLSADALEKALGDASGWPHKTRPAAVSIVQATDMGRVYTPDEVGAVAEIARARGLKVHMDGARFANAVAHLGCSAAEVTWKAGVDILSFGVTKNGGLNADAIVVFSDELAPVVEQHLMRAGLVWSKMRFASAQIAAYVKDGLWLRLALASNDAATRLAAGLEGVRGVRLAAPVQANEVFVEMDARALDAIRDAGVMFARRGQRLARFVCRWDNTAAEVDALVDAVRRAAVTAGG